MCSNPPPPPPPWSDLPQELLTTIAKLLQPNPLDLLSFRTICKSWHSSFPTLPHQLLSPHHPLIISPPPPSLNLPTNLNFTSSALTLNTIFTLHPPHDIHLQPETWLAFIGQINPSRVSIRLPFSKFEFSFSHKLNFLDFNASEIGRYYTLDFEYNNSIRERVLSSEVIKVVVISNGFGLVLLYRDGKLMFFRNGNEWEMIHDGKDFIFDDIVELNGRLLGIDRTGKVYEFDFKSLELIVIVSCVLVVGRRRKRLIESLGMLYLVDGCEDRRPQYTISKFRVYVLNEEVMSWVEVDRICDRIFIIGREFSVSSLAQGFEGFFEKNSIVFTDCSFRKYNSGFVGKLDNSQFPRSKPIIVPVALYNLENGTYVHRIQSEPAYSSLLWPPPTWLSMDYSLHTCHFAFEDVQESISQGDGQQSSSETCRVCKKKAYIANGARVQKGEVRREKDKNIKKRKVDWCLEDDFLGWHEMSDDPNHNLMLQLAAEHVEAVKKEVGTDIGVALVKAKAEAERAEDEAAKAEKELAEAHSMNDLLQTQLNEEIEAIVKLRAEIETMCSTRDELLAAARNDGIKYYRGLVLKALPRLK